MSAIDPYAPCPCGSGEKFKWCCQKAEPFADKAQRLFENHQFEPALEVLSEGLAKHPGNVWLTLRKALILTELERAEEARSLVEAIVAKYPGQVAAQTLLVRLRLESQGLREAIDQLQQALHRVSASQRASLAPAARLISLVLGRFGFAPAAIKHSALSETLLPGAGGETSPSLERSLRADSRISPWMREDWTLSGAPEELGDEERARFDQALKYADEGLWSSAAALFDALELNGVAGADRNLALCRLWLMDAKGAAEAARRASRRLGESAEAVDLEALAQDLSLADRSDQVEQVHLIWTLRDRNLLLSALNASDRTSDAGEEPLDPNDEKSFPVRVFEVLDRAKLEGSPPAVPDDVAEWPHIVARVLIGREIAILETYDDGRLDALSQWFTTLADAALPPAQPRTKVLGELPRSEVALRTEPWLPESLSPEQITSLRKAESRRLLTRVWPETPQPYLEGKTPREAAGDPRLQVPLRAALLRLELTSGPQPADSGAEGVRRELGVAPEPELDPERVDIASVPLSRLHLIPAARLDNDRLATLFRRAAETTMLRASRLASLALVERPEMLERTGIGRVAPYAELALGELDAGNGQAALNWVAKGRQADPAGRGANAIDWDLLELQVEARTETAGGWVPKLAVVMERYGSAETTSPKLLQFLVSMGLIQLVPHPDRPGAMLVDNRPLQALLSEFGPRITTTTGGLGVSASQGGIWTPDQNAPAVGRTTKGGIWTPGSDAGAPAGGGEKPKIFIPGR